LTIGISDGVSATCALKGMPRLSRARNASVLDTPVNLFLRTLLFHMERDRTYVVVTLIVL